MPDPVETIEREPDGRAEPSLLAPELRPRTIDAADRSAAASSAPSRTDRGGLVTVLLTVTGFLGILLIAASAPVWRNAASTWRLTVPGVPHPGTSSQAAATFAIGLLLMCAAWVGMVIRVERMVPDHEKGNPSSERRRRWVMIAVLIIWSIPAMLSTPLLSNDSYSYAAQGEMASQGIDPTARGAYALGRGPFLRAVDPIWRDAPAPYGPVSIQLQEWAVEATGHDPARAVWAMRLLAIVGVAMTAVGVVILAEQHRKSAAVALALGVASPLVILHMLGGSHNDSLMLGFAMVGLAAFKGGRKVLGVALLTLAVGVKLPVALALGFVGWCWYGDREVSFLTRVRSATLVVLSSAAALVAMCSMVGIGFGWVTALRDTGKVTTTFSASTKIGLLVADVGNRLGIDVTADSSVAFFRLVGLIAALVITAVLLLRSPKVGLVPSIGWALTAFMLLGPVLWPWYLPAGLALLAASGIDRMRPSYVVLVVATTWTVWPTSVDPVVGFSAWTHILGFLAISGVVLACVVAQWATAKVVAAHQRRRETLVLSLDGA